MSLHPVASNTLHLRTVSHFDRQTRREVEVARQLVGDGFTPSTPLPDDCTVRLSTFTAEPSDKERHYSPSRIVQPDGQPFQPDGPHWKAPENAYFLAEQTTIQYCGQSPAVLFQETYQSGPDEFHVQLQPGASQGERDRYIRSRQDHHETVAVLAAEVAQKSPATVRAWDQNLASTRGAFLEKRYGQRQNMSILEIGPGTTGVVARALLKANSGNVYNAMDLSPDALRLQKEVLQADQVGEGRIHQVTGDFTRGLPFPDASQDLVCGFSSIGTWEETAAVQSQFDEFARVLKPGGEFLMGGLGLEQASPAAIAFILDRFELIPQREESQSVSLLLRKKLPRASSGT